MSNFTSGSIYSQFLFVSDVLSGKYEDDFEELDSEDDVRCSFILLYKIPVY